MGATIRKHASDPRVAQMLDHFAQYVGSAPDLSPAVLCGIARMQTGEGVWHPRGGTRAVAEALIRLAGELGVELVPNASVESIATDAGGRVAGVDLADGRRVPLGAVVSNSDAVRTHRELLAGRPAARAFERRRGYEPACSGVVLYLGLDRRYDHLLHHNFVFSRDPHEEFDFIYRKGEPAPDPTCYLCAPAATDPSVAPEGGEALYVLVHAPYLRPHHDWDALYPSYRRTILDKLARTAGLTDLESRIRVERRLTPQDIHDRYRVLDGAIYGLSSHGRFHGAFKPANRSPDVPGLYLAGGAAHPGPGMPMVLMSGWIAADALDRDGIVEPRRPSATRREPAAKAAVS
jgi:phytoene desaturase